MLQVPELGGQLRVPHCGVLVYPETGMSSWRLAHLDFHTLRGEFPLSGKPHSNEVCRRQLQKPLLPS